MTELTELKDELYAAPEYYWRHVPITVDRHKWQLRWYRMDDDGFFFSFTSPRGRRYSYFVERGRVTDASVVTARCYTIASYREVWGDKTERRDAVIRLTPRHIINKLQMLLDAIG